MLNSGFLLLIIHRLFVVIHSPPEKGRTSGGILFFVQTFIEQQTDKLEHTAKTAYFKQLLYLDTLIWKPFKKPF